MPTLASNEETFTEPDTSNATLNITNCAYIQNQSQHSIRWSSEDFSPTNEGAIMRVEDREVFSGPQNIFIKRNTPTTILKVHVRSITL